MRRILWLWAAGLSLSVAGILAVLWFNNVDPPQKTEEWAAWVQAFGSISAIVITLGAALTSNAHARELALIDARRRHLLAMAAIIHESESRISVRSQGARDIKGLLRFAERQGETLRNFFLGDFSDDETIRLVLGARLMHDLVCEALDQSQDGDLSAIMDPRFEDNLHMLSVYRRAFADMAAELSKGRNPKAFALLSKAHKKVPRNGRLIAIDEA